MRIPPPPPVFSPVGRSGTKNAIPPYRHAKRALDLELTVAEDDVRGLNVPMSDHALVKKFYCRHALSTALNCELSN